MPFPPRAAQHNVSRRTSTCFDVGEHAHKCLLFGLATGQVWRHCASPGNEEIRTRLVHAASIESGLELGANATRNKCGSSATGAVGEFRYRLSPKRTASRGGQMAQEETNGGGIWSRMMNAPLHWQIAVALALAVLVSLVADEQTTLFGASLIEIFDFFGGLFLNALKMIVVPLIVSSIIMGVHNMAGRENFGRVGGKTVGFYVATGLIAVVTGLVLVNVINPGGGESVKALSENMPDVSDQLTRVEGRDAGDLVDVISRAVPDNIFAAAVNMELLALIFFSVVFGYFMARVEGPPSGHADQSLDGHPRRDDPDHPVGPEVRAVRCFRPRGQGAADGAAGDACGGACLVHADRPAGLGDALLRHVASAPAFRRRGSGRMRITVASCRRS